MSASIAANIRALARAIAEPTISGELLEYDDRFREVRQYFRSRIEARRLLPRSRAVPYSGNLKLAYLSENSLNIKRKALQYLLAPVRLVSVREAEFVLVDIETKPQKTLGKVNIVHTFPERLILYRRWPQ